MEFKSSATVSPKGDWRDAIHSIIWHTLVQRTESRYGELALEDYKQSKGSAHQRERFYKAWTSSVEELFYRLRSSRTRKLFSSTFTQSFCAFPQGKLKAHFNEISDRLLSDTSWEELRDIMMLALSANSFLNKPNKEED